MSDPIQNVYSDLCKAIDKGDKVAVHNLIFNNVDVNTSLLEENKAFTEKNINTLMIKAIHENNHTAVKMIIDHGIEHNPSINLFTSLQTAISEQDPMMIEALIPHCGFSKSSDLYIPRDLVIDPDPQHKECLKILLNWNFTIHPESHQDVEFVYGAVDNGNLQIIEQLLDLGIDVNMVHPDFGVDFLTIACCNRHHEMVEKLLQHNANANAIISENLHFVMLRKFLSYTNDQNNVCTCFHIAVMNSDQIAMKLLLKYGAKIEDDPKLFKITCLAVLKGYEDIVRILLDHGANLNTSNLQEVTFLYQCLLYRHSEQDSRYNIVKLILENGADIYLRIPSNKFVFDAVAGGHHKISQLFLDCNADVQYVDPDGNTLLHAAIKQRFDAQFIITLIKRDIPVHAKNNDGQTSFHLACVTESTDQLDIIKVLLQHNADIHSTDKSLMTPLHYACSTQSLELVKLLLDKGANSNASNQNGQTPLHIACRYGSGEVPCIIQLLLEHHANTEAMDVNGRTPLFWACAGENSVAIKYLLDHHANVNHTDGIKLTPLLFAAYCLNNSAVIKELLKYDADVHCTDMRGDSIIHLIAREGDEELIESFAYTDVNFNSVNQDGDTPLHVAVKRMSVNMTVCLMKYGANIDISNKFNRTPLEEALENAPDEDDDPDFLKENIMITLLLSFHVIKLMVLGVNITSRILKLAYDSNDEDLKVQCEQEIQKMKTEKVGIVGLTFYDLLKGNIHRLSRFVGNEIIEQILNLEIYKQMFPMYIDMIRNRLREAKIRNERNILMNSAIEYFRMNISQRLPYECIDMVLDYLNIRELKMFIEAMKSS